MKKFAKLALALVITLMMMLPLTAMAADLEIATLADLKAFRDAVNAGNSFSGKTVVLTADIDLNNEEWTPIGTSSNKFSGNFDGQNHTVSNLKITMPYSSNVGFFGFTTNGSVKNLTIKNADVEGYLNVGAVAGTPYTSKYSNITLTGKITVDGSAYVGGMFGKSLYANAENLTINASSDSYVRADSNIGGTNYRTYVGGIVGFMGEGNHGLTNVSSNIDVYGSVCDIGGITGIAHYGNKFKNVTCTGDVIVEPAPDAAMEDFNEVGGIAGTWYNDTSNAPSFEGCSFSGELVMPEGAKIFNDGLVGERYTKDVDIPNGANVTFNGEQVDDNYEEVVAPNEPDKEPSTPEKTPVTGDSTPIAMLFGMMLLCGAVMFVMSRKVRA